MKKYFSVAVLIVVLMAGCASTKKDVAQDKTFEMTCPADGCKFNSLVMYAPRQQAQNPFLQALGILAPAAVQYGLGVKQIGAAADVSIATVNAFSGIFGKGGNTSTVTTITDSYNPTTSSQEGTFTWDSSTGDYRGNPISNSYNPIDRHDSVDSVTVPPVTVIQPVITGQ
jgi:hypothetical protein